MTWTNERVEKLQEMWNEGKSAAQIAKALGGVTRNAVIGKVHRLGLSNRGPNGAEVEEAVDEEETAETAAPEAEDERETAPAPEPAPSRALVRDPLRREPAPMTDERLEVLANLAELEKTAKRISLMELTERVCKWPIGDPTDPKFHFCGHASTPGKPYCPAHCAIAFQPMSSRRDRDRHRPR